MTFTKSKSSVVKVPGYYDTRKKGNKSTDKKESRTSMPVEVKGQNVTDPPVQLLNLEKANSVEKLNVELMQDGMSRMREGRNMETKGFNYMDTLGCNLLDVELKSQKR